MFFNENPNNRSLQYSPQSKINQFSKKYCNEISTFPQSSENHLAENFNPITIL